MNDFCENLAYVLTIFYSTCDVFLTRFKTLYLITLTRVSLR